jgi:invasion protein IalB
MRSWRAIRFGAALIAAGIAAAAAGLPASAQETPEGETTEQPQAPAKNKFGPRIKPAQGTGQQGPAPEVVATHGDWKIQCETAPKAASGEAAPRKQCGMVQTTRNEKQPKAMLTLVLVKEKQNDKVVPMMRVVAPIGVFLPTGIALEVDGAAVGRVPFTRCLRQVCFAFAAASGDMFEKLRKGKTANFIIYEGPGLALPMKISLSGFSAAFAALDEP